jgi:copper transport protein
MTTVRWRRSPSLVSRGLRALLLAVVLAAIGAGVASAHASLVRSDPPANTRLDRSPETVTVWFDQQIEPQYAYLSVFDTNSQRVDHLDARLKPGDEPSLTLTLPALPAGSYVVVWRVISVDDGHAVGGAFAFGVGVAPNPQAAAAAGAQADTQPDSTSHLIRFLDLVAEALLFGAVVFRSLVWEPALGAAGRSGELRETQALTEEERRWLQVFADILVGALIIGLLGSLYSQARTTGVLFWQLFATHWGVVWLIRAASVLWASLWMESLLEGRRNAGWRWGLSLALLVTTTLTSHSGAKPGLLAPAADLLHLVSASVWAGGLVMLVLTLLILHRSPLEMRVRSQLGAEVIARFAGLAAGAVGLLLATGLLLAWQQVQSWGGLLLTDYGRSLLVKLGLALVALGLGAYNSIRSPERIRADARGQSGRAPGWVAAESAAVAAVIFVAAVMTDLPPATAAGTAGASSGNAVGAVLTTTGGGWQFETRVSPGRIGSNVFELTLAGADGIPITGAKPSLQFLSLAGGPATKLDLPETKAGVYTGTGAGLSRQGSWQIAAKVDRSNNSEPAVSATYAVDVSVDGAVRSAGAQLPVAVQLVSWLDRNGRLALVLLVVMGVAGWSWIASRARQGVARLGWLASGLLLGGVVVAMIVLAG